MLQKIHELDTEWLNTNVCEYLGARLGMLGAFVLASNYSWSGAGFILFLISNFFLIRFALLTDHHELLRMQLVFTATSLLGIFRWLI